MVIRTYWAVLLAFATRTNAGGVLELVPDKVGPHAPGQAVGVEVWLHNEEAFSIDLRLIALDIQGLRDRLFAGGDFLTSGGVTVNHVAKLSGGAWTPLEEGLAGPVLALAPCSVGLGTTLYAGGHVWNGNNFEATVNRMEYGGGWWTEIGRDTSGRTLSLLCANDGPGQGLYAGGYLSDFEGTGAEGIAKWDGAAWAALEGLNGNVRDMLVFDDGIGTALYVAGSFPNPMPPNQNVMLHNVARWTGNAWAPLANGLRFGYSESTVNSLAAFDDGSGPKLFAAGDFWYEYLPASDSVRPVLNIARWTGAGWSSLGGATHSDYAAVVNDMTAFDDGRGPGLFVGGRFNHVGGVPSTICSATLTTCNQQLLPFMDDGLPVSNVARWDGTTWSDVGGGVSGGDAVVNALTVLDDGSGPALYAGGRFTDAGGVGVSNIAKWNGATWSPVGAGFDDSVRALAVHEGTGDPNLMIEGVFQFDFSTLTDGGVNYVSFPQLPGPLTLYAGKAPIPGSILHVPANGSLRLGTVEVVMPNTPGNYRLDVASPYGPRGGSIVSFGFGGPNDPYTDWLAEAGEITGEPIPFTVEVGPPESIPAVSTWGMIVTALLVLSSATCVLSRQPRAASGCR